MTPSALFHQIRDTTQLATTFSVSRQATYVRLVSLGLAEQDAYDAWSRAHYRDDAEIAAASTDDAEVREGGPSFYNIYLHRMSFPYLRQVFDSYHDEKLSLNELSDYLGVRPRTALALDEQFARRLRGRAS